MKTNFFKVLSCVGLLTLGCFFVLPSNAEAQQRVHKKTTGETPSWEVIICDGSGNDCSTKSITIRPNN